MLQPDCSSCIYRRAPLTLIAAGLTRAPIMYYVKLSALE